MSFHIASLYLQIDTQTGYVRGIDIYHGIPSVISQDQQTIHAMIFKADGSSRAEAQEKVLSIIDSLPTKNFVKCLARKAGLIPYSSGAYSEPRAGRELIADDQPRA